MHSNKCQLTVLSGGETASTAGILKEEQFESNVRRRCAGLSHRIGGNSGIGSCVCKLEIVAGKMEAERG